MSLGFSRRQYLALTAAVAVGYLSLLMFKYEPSRRSGEAFHLELLLGSYTVQLRTSLKAAGRDCVEVAG